MKAQWLKKGCGRKLVIFFTGWGMDANPVGHMDAGSNDLLMFYDYRGCIMPLDLSEACRKYESVALVAWSLGVAAAGCLCNDLGPLLDSTLAVNGTLYPAHGEYGIPEDVFDGTIEALSEESLSRFYRRMCGSRELFGRFMERAPARGLEEIGEELRILRGLKPAGTGLFRSAIIGLGDRIVPAGNQANCWRMAGARVAEVDMPHFPFYEYECWDELIRAGSADG